uniref:Short-chain dehydrogenase TIC 32, chloroplastic-like isoform X2 n=1 Tax=Nicotiana tabacum TaxID=4097 RepID=A0A1S3XFS1_TOBAC|nr:short-chain dehydrogenase TIC 32, chloroplastic-like isoform X2 [Nicotiana tomentosiformis]XP_016438624.1 PREDICTED: short-chain dehydrogenase TIC 32, chloroplastic-like isoform X2 [Nicotiana tabacum]
MSPTVKILSVLLRGKKFIHLINICFAYRHPFAGASSGIRSETSRVLALRGVHVIMAVRNMAAGKDVKEEIVKEIPAAKVDVMELDLRSMASVRKFAAGFISSGHSLNMLINNAGVGGNSLYAFQRQHRAAICHKSSREHQPPVILHYIHK